MGMKIIPFTVGLACAALLVSCGRQRVGDAGTDKQVQEQVDEQHQARQQSELREREAALDERERLLNEREQQSPLAADAPPTAPDVPPVQPVPPGPLAPAAPPLDAAQPQADATSPEAGYQLFYDALSTYGSWIEMPGYGYVWQPWTTVQDPRWRPYTIGGWVFTDAGWTWMSDEPFGWITYHYGRWMRTHTLGWVWVPGDQWAPAWVSWRYGNDFAGWAPLPPEARFDGATGIQQWADQQYNLGAADYTFVPASDFGDESMAGDEVPPDQEAPIYDASNNVTNIYYDSGASGIICYGPSYEFMRSKSHHPIPRLTLHRGGYRANGDNGAVIAGNGLTVAAPRIVPSRIPVSPKTVRGTVADARLVRTSQAGPAASAPTALALPIYSQSAPGAAGAANPLAPAGIRAPSRANAPHLSAAEAQTIRDLEIIQQDQQAAAVERQRQEADRGTGQWEAEPLRAEQAVRIPRTVQEQPAKVVHEQERLVREQAVRAVPPATLQERGP